MSHSIFDSYVAETFGVDPAEFETKSSGPEQDDEPVIDLSAVVGLLIEPQTASIVAGDTAQFHAASLFAGGDQQDETGTVEWTSSDPALLSFTNPGQAVAARTLGAVIITITDPNTQMSATAKVTIVAGPSTHPDKGGEAKPSEGEQPRPKKNTYEKAYDLGLKDGFDGRTARPEFIQKYFYETGPHASSLAAYQVGYQDGTYKHLMASGDIQQEGHASVEGLRLMYEQGRADGRVGKPVHRPERVNNPEMPPPVQLDDPATMLKAYEAGYKETFDNWPHTPEAMYLLGKTDGLHDDPIHLKEVEAVGDAGLLKNYKAGLEAGKDAFDSAWGEGDKQTNASTPNAPQTPGLSKRDLALTGVGVVSTLISVLEAKGLVASAGVGTTIGAVLLPITAFFVGTDIAMKREEREAAIHDFVARFKTVVIVDSLEQARSFVKSQGVELIDLNDEGTAMYVELMQGWSAKMDEVLRDKIGDKPKADELTALYEGWVKQISKAAAKIMGNPRYR